MLTVYDLRAILANYNPAAPVFIYVEKGYRGTSNYSKSKYIIIGTDYSEGLAKGIKETELHLQAWEG